MDCSVATSGNSPTANDRPMGELLPFPEIGFNLFPSFPEMIILKGRATNCIHLFMVEIRFSCLASLSVPWFPSQVSHSRHVSYDKMSA